jgi:hypothetical protein
MIVFVMSVIFKVDSLLRPLNFLPPVMPYSPSEKKLEEVFPGFGKEAKRIFKMTREELVELPAGKRRVDECYNPPKTCDIRMNCLNELFGTHGVEFMRLRNGQFADYLNTGDTYAPTIIFANGRYYIGSWGDTAA